MTVTPPSPISPASQDTPVLESATAPLAPSAVRPDAKSETQVRDRLVMVCMGMVTAAVAAMLYQQFGYSLAASMLLGGIAWCAMMLVQVQMRKTDQIHRLKVDVKSLQTELAHLRGEPAAAATAPFAGTSPIRGASRNAARPPRGPASSSASGHAAGVVAAEAHQDVPQPAQALTAQMHDVSAPLRLDPAARWESPSAPQRSSANPPNTAKKPTMSQPVAQQPSRPLAPTPIDAALWPGTSVSAGDPMRDQWAFRPDAAAGLSSGTAPNTRQSMETQRHEPTLPAGEQMTSLDADLELVQRKIKALADEVNTAEAMKVLVQPPSQPAALPNAIETTIGALKVTAQAMREPRATAPPQREAVAPPAPPPQSSPQGLPADLFIPSTAETIAASQPAATPDLSREPHAAQPIEESEPLGLDPSVFEALARAASPPPPISPQIAALTQAIDGGQMDVFLSPIVGLDSHDVRHYEVAVRLKSEAGTYFDDQDGMLQLAGPGMLALFDAARLTRTAIVADRLEARGKTGSLLSEIAGGSITDGGFLETFTRIYEQRGSISSQLVLTFKQADIERLPSSAWQALGDMHAFGFRFALSGIEHLNSDFEGLAERGFMFVKLPASAFIEGIPSRDHFIAPHDMCKRLAGAGLTLVAETIDREDIRARVFGFGVVLGQGLLFGGARHVSLDPVPHNSSQAA